MVSCSITLWLFSCGKSYKSAVIFLVQIRKISVVTVRDLKLFSCKESSKSGDEILSALSEVGLVPYLSPLLRIPKQCRQAAQVVPGSERPPTP